VTPDEDFLGKSGPSSQLDDVISNDDESVTAGGINSSFFPIHRIQMRHDLCRRPQSADQSLLLLAATSNINADGSNPTHLQGSQESHDSRTLHEEGDAVIRN